MSETVNLQEFDPESMPLSCTWIIIGGPGTGKCFRQGTGVIMHNGSINYVEDIKIGDMLMGDDSTPRTVTRLYRGTDKFYKITPSDNTDPYYVTGKHVLCLHFNQPHTMSAQNGFVDVTYHESFTDNDGLSKVRTSFRTYRNCSAAYEEFSKHAENPIVFEIEVEKYMELNDKFTSSLSAYRTGIDFPETPVPLDPYFVGVVLACDITNGVINGFVSAEVYEYLKTYAESIGMHLEGSIKTPNLLDFHGEQTETIQYVRALTSNCIPDIYKYNSETVRFKLLSGILDVLLLGNQVTVYVKNPRFNKDFEYLVRSLGIQLVKYKDNLIVQLVGDLGKLELLRYRNGICDWKCNLDYNFVVEECPGVDYYYGFELDGNKRFLMSDFTVTHNSTLIENFAYFLKHRYPIARVFSGTEEGYKRFCKIFGALYVSNYWNEGEETKYITRQRNRVMKYGEGTNPGNASINIMDDIGDDPRVFKTPLMRSIFKLGSRHWDHLVMIGNQYAIDFPPDIRKSISFVALGKETSPIELKKLYENFGGECGTFEQFCKYMKDVTGDHTFLIINKRSQTSNPEDCLSWFQTKPMGDWTFGCKEYRQWNKDRYNPNYVDKIVM